MNSGILLDYWSSFYDSIFTWLKNMIFNAYFVIK